MKQRGDKWWGRSVTKVKEIYSAEDTKSELAGLRLRIQTCHQNLQIKCAIRTDNSVANANAQLEALRTPFMENQNMLGRIEERVGDRISKAEDDGERAQALVGISQMSASEASQSLKDTKEALETSDSTSDMETKYLKIKVKALTEALPKLQDAAYKSNHSSKGSNVAEPTWNQWVNRHADIGSQEKTREDSVQESIRLLKLLRSGKEISYSDAQQDLYHLNLTLGDLGLHDEAAEISMWSIRLCRQLLQPGDVGFMRPLAKSLHSHSINLINAGRIEEALNASMESADIFRQLVKEKKLSLVLPGLALSLEGVAVNLTRLGRDEDALVVMEEATEIYRKLVVENPTIVLPELASCLSNLADALCNLERFEGAVEASDEAVNIYRQLVQTRP